LHSSNQIGETRICRTCEAEKEIGEFPIRSSPRAKIWRKLDCKNCINKKCLEKRRTDPVWNERRNKQRREKRANDPAWRENVNERKRKSRNPNIANKRQRELYRNNQEYREKVQNLNRAYLRKVSSSENYRKRKRKYYKKRKKRAILGLSDNYLKELLSRRSNLKHASIPQELIEAKRQQLLIIRHLRG